MRDNADMSNRIIIIGGGISGLATAYRLRKLRPDSEVIVLEAGDTPGGKVRTTVRDGYVVEWGPNGFLTNATDTRDLALELGLEAELRVASDAARKRYVFRDGGLRPIPTSPPALLRTELLSATAKVRAALEPVLARRHGAEETVSDFVARHFGRAIARDFAEPLVLGISAGDPDRLSLDALFPRMRQLEREHRSLLLGMIAAARKAPPRPAGRGRLTSFRAGTGQLIGALERALGDAIRTGFAVERVRPNESGGLSIETAEGSRLDAAAAVLAVPAHAAARLVADAYSDAAPLLAGIPFAPVRVFGLGFDRIDVPRVLDGFGFLAPSGEGIRILGVLWSSAVFSDHAPRGKVLLRVLAGGVRDPAFAALDIDEALNAVREDLRTSMGIVAEPEFVEHVAWPRGIPQYELGHAAVVEEIERSLARSESAPIALTGNSYRGIGLNDCVRDANRVAGVVAARVATRAGSSR